MVSFYPGPSKLIPHLEHYIQNALNEGILSENHRSDAFMQLHKLSISTLKKHLGIPEEYSIYFVSSATECWEILNQDLAALKSVHAYNGAFGEKWFHFNKSLNPSTSSSILFDKEEELPRTKIKALLPEVINITQNETSNGTQVNNNTLALIRKENPNAFINIDATSSLGGQDLIISNADAWFASVQKCFGLPSGMALLICSKRIIEYCKTIPKTYYNSIAKQEEQYQKHQTTHTPNTLDIYLLHKSLLNAISLEGISIQLEKQAQSWYSIFKNNNTFQLLIKNTTLRSSTIIAFNGDTEAIERLKKECRAKGFIIGNGYGEQKNNTFRIANFPAHTESEIQTLQNILINF